MGSSASTKDRIELFKMGDTFNTLKRIGSYAALAALGWALAGANQSNILPDTAATVLLGVAFVKML